MYSPLAPLPETGHVFDTSWPVLSSDLDEAQRVRPDGVARYLQEAGMRHLEATEMVASHPHWIVRRTVIDVLHPVTWPNRIRLRRWCSGLAPRWCTMRVRIDSEDGGLIETEGFWINMNIATMGVARLSDEFFAIMSSTTDEHRLRWRPWLTGTEGEPDVQPFPLRRTDFDHFEHVTNSVYWQGVHEVLGAHRDLVETPHRYVIEYDKPIAAAELVQLESTRTADGLAVRFTVAGEVRTRAFVTDVPPRTP